MIWPFSCCPLVRESLNGGLANGGLRYLSTIAYPEGLARHLDVSRQKLTPHCLATIFDSQLPSPKLSPNMPPKLSLAHFFLFQNYPRGEGNCETIERQKLSRGNFCPATSRCLFWPTGYDCRHFVTNVPLRKGPKRATKVHNCRRLCANCREWP